MAHDVFISYSSKDKNIADAACALLEARGVRCWMAPRDIIPGSEWGAAIINAIGAARVMVLIYTSSSNASPQVRREVERAVAHGLHVIPFRVEDVPMSPALEYFISSPHWLDALSPPMERHLDHLSRIITAVLDAQSAADVPQSAPAQAIASERWAHGPPPGAFIKPPAVAASNQKTLLIAGGVLVLVAIAAIAISIAVWSNQPGPTEKNSNQPSNTLANPVPSPQPADAQRIEPPPVSDSPPPQVTPKSQKSASQQDASSFWDLIRQGSPRIAQVQSALDDHADLANMKNADGNTPLFEAARSGQGRLVTLLLSSGADRSNLSSGKNTPLHGAAMGGISEQPVIDALAYGNINTRNADGNAPIHLAVQAGNAQTIALLAEARADINLPDQSGRTPLQSAMLLTDPAKARATALALINLGAKLDTPDKRGNTPVYLAAATGDLPLLNAMLEKGAKVNVPGDGGRTPLHAAIAAGRTDAVKALLAHKAPVDLADNAGDTPLHLAAALKDPAIAEMLLRAGAKVTTWTKERQTPLHVAAAAGNVAMVELFIANGGGDVISTGKSPTPAEVAQKAGKTQIVELLGTKAIPIKLQAAIRAKSAASPQLLDAIRKNPALAEGIGPDNQNAVHLCAAWGNDTLAAQLIAINPAWAMAFSTKDETPLHLAAQYRQTKVAAQLLNAGASVLATNNLRETPLHSAARSGAGDVIKLLLDWGADPNAGNRDGQTPADVASNPQIKKILATAAQVSEPIRQFWDGIDLEGTRFSVMGPGLTEPVKIRFHDGKFSMEGNIGGNFKSYDGAYKKGPLSLMMESPEGQIFPGIPGKMYIGKVEQGTVETEFSIRVGTAKITFTRP